MSDVRGTGDVRGMRDMRGTGARKSRLLVFLLILTLGWMAMIFYMSAQPATASTETSMGLADWIAGIFRPDYRTLPAAEQADFVTAVNNVIRKLAHFSEYAVLGVWLSLDVLLGLGRRGADVSRNEGPRGGDDVSLHEGHRGAGSSGRRCMMVFLMAWILGTAFAVSDEFHQLFVEGRSGEVLDVLIDSGGVLVGAAVVCLVNRLVSKRSEGKLTDTR